MERDSSSKKSVAPGYPAVETLRDLAVSGWEPAAVFHPVELPKTDKTEDREFQTGE